MKDPEHDTGSSHETPDRPLHITREVPLWGLLSVLGMLALQAVGLYYSNQALSTQVADQGRQLIAMASDMRAISTELNQRAIRDATTTYRVDDLTRRVTAIELLQTARTK